MKPSIQQQQFTNTMVSRMIYIVRYQCFPYIIMLYVCSGCFRVCDLLFRCFYRYESKEEQCSTGTLILRTVL